LNVLLDRSEGRQHSTLETTLPIIHPLILRQEFRVLYCASQKFASIPNSWIECTRTERL
jgi:hypothetical protein